ncbi:MAG: DUF3187 family protein [Pseudomonadota bacterium]
MSRGFPGLLLVLSAAATFAEPNLDAPFAVSNRNPFVQVQGLPPARGADLVPAGRWVVDVRAELANSFSLRERNDEAIDIDGETWRAELTLSRGLGDDLDVALRVPYLRHEGGNLDGFIENWHDFWGLPDGDRDLFPRDQLDYRYAGPGGSFALPGDGGGIGDIGIAVGWTPGGMGPGWALRGGVELPTGAADRLTGSGGTAAWASIHRRTPPWGADEQFVAHLSGGVSYGETGDVLPGLRNRWIGFGSATVSWLAWQNLALKAQLDVHSAPYESALKELGGSVQLVFGLSWRIGSSATLDLSLAEDLYVDTAPDVVFQAGLRWRP